MFKPQKPRNIRKKLSAVSVIEIEDDDLNSTPDELPSIGSPSSANTASAVSTDSSATGSTRARKEKKKKPKPSSLGLSFDAEEDADEGSFQIKKSSASRRMAKSKTKTILLDCEKLPNELETQKTTMDPPRLYTREHLDELRAASTPSESKFASTSDIVAQKFPTTVGAGEDSLPDANAVYAARLRRQMAREGLESGPSQPPVESKSKDYISLNDDDDEMNENGKQVGKYTGLSRLTRDDDDEEDGEYSAYVGEKLALTAAGRKQEIVQRKAGIQDNLETFDDNMNEDDDQRDWEIAQIRKGGFAKMGKIVERAATHHHKNVVNVKVPEVTTLPSIVSVRAQLKGCLRELQQQNTSYAQQLSQIEKDKRQVEQLIDKFADSIKTESTRYMSHQELNRYILGLSDFLDTKAPELETLEQEYISIIRNRADSLEKRTRANLEDYVYTLQGSELSMPATIAVDEFGRDLAGVEQASRVRRQKERAERKLLRAQKCQRPDDIPDGVSSDEDIEMHDEASLNDLQARNELLFSDALEEYATLPAICKKFNSWKDTQREDYDRIYGALSIPGAVDVFVRHEMVTREPFSQKFNLDDTAWHKELSLQHFIDDADDAEGETAVLNLVVVKSIVPIILRHMNHFDPRSRKQTFAAVHLFEQLLYYVKRSSEHFISIAEQCFAKFADEVLFDCQLHSQPRLLEEVVSSDVFEHARVTSFHQSLKLLKNILALRKYLPEDKAKDLTFQQLLPNRLLPLMALKQKNSEREQLSRHADMYALIVESLPNEWIFGENGKQMIAELKSLETAMVALATRSGQEAADPGSMEKLRSALRKMNSPLSTTKLFNR